MKIIFLDIDGVIINRASCKKRYDSADPGCVTNLNGLIAKTGAKLVLSSCWRIGRTVKELNELLVNWGVQGEVIDKTVELPGMNVQRGDEIGQWLREHQGEVEAFVIIDDDADMGQLLPHLVHTRFAPGMTANDAEMAIKVLAKTQNPAKSAGSV